MSKKANKYLYLRNDRWSYKRNVPKKFRHIESRTRIRAGLNTSSLDIARMRRDALVEADDLYWISLSLEADETNGITEATRQVHEHRYKAASKRALLFGFIYKTAQQLRSETSIEEIMDRLDALTRQYDHGTPPPKRETEALLGGVPKPHSKVTMVSKAFQLYVDEIAFDAQFRKSPAQRKSWEKAKRTSINYFIETLGNIAMQDITREHALKYRNWWAQRLKTGDEYGNRPKPYTANRHMGNMRSLYRSFFEYQGEEDRPNPFRRLSFKDDKKKTRLSFDNEWIRNKVLVPDLFDSLNAEALHIVYVLIETGARPSEICNLLPENIHLDVPIPYISIREKPNREVKATDSNRDIPLMGIALDAMRKQPKGFPRYFDKEGSLSKILLKAFNSRDLFPTHQHVIYSLRHSFEDRMLEADIDYGLRCTLMGHKNNRPSYGSGGSLAYKQKELLKIVHPYPKNLIRP